MALKIYVAYCIESDETPSLLKAFVTKTEFDKYRKAKELQLGTDIYYQTVML